MNPSIPARYKYPLALWLISFSLWSYAQTLARANTGATQQVTAKPQTYNLPQLLDALEKRYRVRFNYQANLVRRLSIQVASLDVFEGRIEPVLSRLLLPLNWQCKQLSSTTFVVQPVAALKPLPTKEEPESTAAEPPAAGTIAPTKSMEVLQLSVAGRVTTQDTPEGIAGVNVLLKGTNTGTATDATGSYRISVPDDGEGTLVFSYIGYQTQEVAIGKRTQVNIMLLPTVRSLDEVVVVGYGTVRKSDLTGAVSQIKTDDVKRAATTSLDQMLQGRAAGVVVTQTSAAPGGGLQVRVRGTNSINGGNDPLYVVDGVPLNIDNNSNTAFNTRYAGGNGGTQLNTLASINPNDIESIEILKDASATAIYGSRGANGVVLITTKKGKAGKSVVEFDASYGVQRTERRLSLLNAQQFIALNTEARAGSVSGTGAPAPLAGVFNPSANAYDTDWQDALFRTAPVQNYQLAFRGGDDRTRYAVSGNYFNQQGIVKGTDTKRYAVRINLDRNVSTRLKVGINLTASRTATNQGFSDGGTSLISSALRMAPNQPILLNGVYLNNANPVDAINAGTDLGLNQAGVSPLQSPLYYADLVTNRRMDNRVLGNFFGELLVLKGLTYRLNLGLDALESKGVYYEPTNGGIRSNGGASDRNTVSNFNTLIENTFNYNRSFGSHAFSAVIGQTAQRNVFDLLRVAAESLNDNTGPYSYDGNTLISNDRTANNNSWQMLSFLGRVNYGYRDKYLLTASFRADGSSRFGSNRKWGYFPAMSAAWIISKEPFLAGVSTISNLKLRAGYGQTGSQEIGLFNSLSTLSSVVTVFNNIQAVGRQPARIPNPDLSWEKTSQVNVGVDAGLWQDRVFLSANYYSKLTEALLYNMETPRISGFSSVVRNIGSVSNRGWELELSTVNFRGAFQWNTSINASYNRNRIESLPTSKALVSNDNLLQEGVALGSIYGYRTAGLFQAADNISGSAQPNALPGERRYVDVNGDNVINANDRVVLGLRDPQYIYGINNAFSYKGLALSVFFQGVSGNVIYNQTRAALLSLDGRINNLTDAADRWTPTNTATNIPRAIQVGSRNGAYGSAVNDFFVESGSYFRLKNVTLSYTLPQAVSRLVGISNARIYVSSDNLYTWTNYKGFNPDLTGGNDNGPYPNPRVVTGGVAIGF